MQRVWDRNLALKRPPDYEAVHPFPHAYLCDQRMKIQREYLNESKRQAGLNPALFMDLKSQHL